jgi:amidase
MASTTLHPLCHTASCPLLLNIHLISAGYMQGSGVATSAGMAFTTLGSDTGGSIRFPAAACGTVGLKPTWGRVSRHGVLDLGQTLDHVGPLCRCTADAAITLQVIAGQDKNDPTSLPLPPPSLFTEGSDWAMLLDLPADRKPLRIGVDASYNTEGVDPELSVAVGAAIAKLAEATGATIVPCSMPKDLMKYCEAWQTLCAPEAAHAHRAAGTWPSRRDDYGSSFRDYLEQGDALSAVEYADARILREQCVGELNTMFADNELDVFACPSSNSRALEDRRSFEREKLLDSATYGGPDNPMHFTAPWDYSGHPTLTVPCVSHFTSFMALPCMHLRAPRNPN